MVIKHLLVILSTVLLSAPGIAAENTWNNTEVINAVTNDILDAAILRRGDKIVTHMINAVGVQGERKDGTVYELIGTSCDVGGVKGCQGLQAMICYDNGSSGPTVEMISRANERYAAIQTASDRSRGKTCFTRYVVLDNGITKANLLANINVLHFVAPLAVKIVFP